MVQDFLIKFNKMPQSSFFWKFSRDGAFSKTYAAFIVDVPDYNVIKSGSNLILLSSFKTICKILILLQDIEIVNKKNGEKRAGLEKIQYIEAVKACGFIPPSQFSEKRTDIVCGQAVVGRHVGFPLDWGYYKDNDEQNIKIDVTSFQPALHISGESGVHHSSGSRDLLSCYRQHQGFNRECMFWDLMPRHASMASLFSAIEAVNPKGAEEFASSELGWRRI